MSVHTSLENDLLKRGGESNCSCVESTVVEWVSSERFSAAATSAKAPTGYTQTLTNGTSWKSGDAFLGYTEIDEYDSSICASLCDSLEECSSFNVYFEKKAGSADSIVKCAFWAGYIEVEVTTATTAVIAGCNGYTKNTVTVPKGFETPSWLGGAAIHPPQGSGYFIGSKVFQESFDTSRCAAECQSHGCAFFNTYIVSKNGVVEGQYCDLYTVVIGKEWATETGSSNGNTNYTISKSFTCGWAGANHGAGESHKSSLPQTTKPAGSNKGGSWEHDHPWHGSKPGPKTTTTTTTTVAKTTSTGASQWADWGFDHKKSSTTTGTTSNGAVTSSTTSAGHPSSSTTTSAGSPSSSTTTSAGSPSSSTTTSAGSPSSSTTTSAGSPSSTTTTEGGHPSSSTTTSAGSPSPSTTTSAASPSSSTTASSTVPVGPTSSQSTSTSGLSFHRDHSYHTGQLNHQWSPAPHPHHSHPAAPFVQDQLDQHY
ncbi:hypothetical protein HRR76_002593 [Exophiala dermatitidis]|nr:hypothetical protein HRR76_002593 [Exophiala dermatitidis]